MSVAAVERDAPERDTPERDSPELDDEVESRELVQAREALLELLATTLDDALVLVTDSHRAQKLDAIAATCDRIGFLGQAARRLGG